MHGFLCSWEVLSSDLKFYHSLVRIKKTKQNKTKQKQTNKQQNNNNNNKNNSSVVRQSWDYD